MCRSSGELVDHLLIHCPMAGMLWSFVFHSFNIHWVLPKRVVDLLCGWWNMLGRHNSDVWNLVPPCLMWTLWHERNRHTFEEERKSGNQVLEGFIMTLFEWSRTWGFTSSITAMHFISSLSLNSSPITFVNP
jgi:hypothetical protein